MEAWLQDAVNQKKPVLLIFAQPGNALGKVCGEILQRCLLHGNGMLTTSHGMIPAVGQLGKIRKNDEVKMAKFGHVLASSDSTNPLMKKYKIKKVPAVLIGSTGDPSALNRSGSSTLLRLAANCT